MAIPYIPILKWKQGEQIAISKLEDSIKDTIIPLSCLMSNDITSSIRTFTKHWPCRAFMLDFHSKSKVNDSKKIEFFDEFEKAGFPFIPVTNPLTSLPVIAKAKSLNRGLAIRVDAKLDFQKVVQPYLSSCGFSPENIDLIIDAPWLVKFRDDCSLAKKIILPMIDECYKYAKKNGNFRRLIFSGSSFPEMLSKLSAYSITRLSRTEWKIWIDLCSTYENLLFGDYGIDDPNDLDLSGGATIIPTIRYTHDSNWYIIRGKHDVNNPYDYSQFHKLSSMVVSNKIYSGLSYSWGDEKINACAKKSCTSINCNHGHPGEWVKIGLNHHITYVSHQVASLP